jgi:excisionase family DNA binding protein
MDEQTITIEQARKALNLGRTKINDLMNAGELTKLKSGRRTLITAESVYAYVERGVRASKAQGR